ncbi:pectinesterase family protein [Metabacillus litoralis]|uniref:pectinesterase family protein n=1 Tax=Metabacillus litoralis TaxID=152268 RepID=UPI00203A3AB0|nr:pectinesterase family protein [Metabacillus litoralis]MCM3409986.1 pectinesterase family protein [Metabacillus litoralis]
MRKIRNILLSFILLISFIQPFAVVKVAAAGQDYFFADDFESSELTDIAVANGRIGDYYAESYSNKGDAWVKNDEANFSQVVEDPLNTINKVLKLTDLQNGDADKGGATRIIHNSFANQGADKVAVIEFDFMAEEVGSSSRIRLMNQGGNNALVSLETSGDSLGYRTATGLVPLVDHINTNTWYKIKITADMRSETYSVVISGGADAVARELPFYQSVSDFGRLDVNTGNSSTATYFIDNIKMYNPTVAPAAPSNVHATPGDKEANISWETVSDAMKYNVKRSTSEDGEYETVASEVTDFTFRDTGLENGTTYFYVVSGINSIGEGLDSVPVSVTPTAAQELPQPPEQYIVNDDFEGASWPTEATNSKTGDIGSYEVEVSSNKGPAWVFDASQNYAQITDAPALANNKVLKLYDSQGANDDKGGLTRVLNQSFTPQTTDKTVIVEFDLMAETFGSGTRFRLMNQGGNNALASLEVSGGGLALRAPDSTMVQLINNPSSNTWYHIKITADLMLEKYDVIVTGGTNTELRSQPFYQSVSDFGRFDMNTGNSSISTLYLDNIQIYNPSNVPSKPTDVTSVAGNGQIKLNWSPARGATSYNVKRSTAADGTFETIATNVTDLTFKDTGLENETTYYYVVTGVNSVGEGEVSTVVSVTPSSAVPLPAAPAVTPVSKSGSVELTWQAVEAADIYTVKRSTTEGGTFEAIATVTAPATSYLDSGLDNGTSYYYIVQASGVGGDGPDSEVVTVKANAPLAHPENVKTKVGNSKVEITWDQVQGATSYTVKRSTTKGGYYIPVATDLTELIFKDETVENGTTYYYVVTAASEDLESMISAEATAKPYEYVNGTTSVPTGLGASATTDQVELKWNAVEGTTSYTVKRKTGSEDYAVIAENVQETSYTDSEVTTGTQYDYVITAKNGAGESAPTNKISAIPAKTIVVAKDESGDFTTVQAAIDSIPSDNNERIVVYIKNGTYKEKVTITQKFVTLVGESQDETVIEWDDYGGTDGRSGSPGGTFESQTVKVTGDYFRATNLTFLNSRTPRSTYGTAVGLSVSSEEAILTNVNILGYQDTLYNGSGKQYYYNTYIEGDVDFIFGEAPVVVIDQSEIKSVGTTGYVTAAAQRNEADRGYVFLNSRLTKSETAEKVYLGRPWKYFADTTFINTWMDSHIRSEGWREWSGTTNHEVASYNEYNSTGPGANSKGRVSWSNQLTAEEASEYTIPKLFGNWDPTQTVVMPYISGTVEDINVMEVVVEQPPVQGGNGGGTPTTPPPDPGREDDVVTVPSVDGNKATVTSSDIEKVKDGGTFTVNLEQNNLEVVDVVLTAEQMKQLKDKDAALLVKNQDVTLTIPVEMFDNENTSFTLKKLPVEKGALSDVYDFTITQGENVVDKFNKPITLSFKVNVDIVKDPSKLKVFYYNEETKKWEEVGGSYKDGVVTAETNHFSIYTVFEVKKEEPKDTATPKERYDRAVKAGNQLLTLLKGFNSAIDSGNINKINGLYNEFSNQLSYVEGLIGSVSGSKNRQALNDKYVTPAKVAKERVIYEISQLRLLSSINEQVKADYFVDDDFAKLDRLIRRADQIKKAGGYKALPGQINQYLRYQDALINGNYLYRRTSAFGELILAGHIADIDDEYDYFTKLIQETQIKVGKVSGKSNRDQLDQKYVRAALVEKERVIYEVSQYRIIEKIKELLAAGNETAAADHLAKLERLKNRAIEIKAAGGYNELPKSIAAELEEMEQGVRE